MTRKPGLGIGRLARMAVCLAPLTLAAGCNDTSTTSDSVTVAVVDVTVQPETVTSQPSTNADFQRMASFTLDLDETAGTGATIASVNTTVAEAAGGITVVSANPVEYQVHVDSTTNRIEANGTASIGFDVSYTLPGGGSEALATVALSINDDNGVAVGGSFQVLIH